jgi:hypothetical protein
VSAGRVIAIVAGVLVGLVGLSIVVGAAVVLWANATQRDADGFFSTRMHPVVSSGVAVASERIDLAADPEPFFFDDVADRAEVRVRARAADPGRSVFVGIGPAAGVREYLAGSPYSEIDDASWMPFRVSYRQRPGDAAPPPPSGRPGLWVASAEGPGQQTVRWPLERGRWVLVVMNADAAPGVAADVSLGLRFEPLGAVAVALLIVGLVVLGVGAVLLVLGVRRRGPPAQAAATSPAAPGAPSPVRAAGPSPVRVEGVRDAAPSRWLWLVKWLLLIPHILILMILWVVFAVLTIVAFVAIVFSGRYPRGIFDLNVGIMRWSWRVGFYGYSALGTDRYPPFALDHADHPAVLDVHYPERLSRGLVWVKWLLAFPHYLIVGLFGTGLWWSAAWAGGDGWSGAFWGGGLVGVIILIVAVALLFTGRYPGGLFDLVMGLNRWAFRVLVYVALMTDRYPPFRLDMGGREPAESLIDSGDTLTPSGEGNRDTQGLP